MKKLFLFLTLFALTFSLNSVANAYSTTADVVTSTDCFDGDSKNPDVDYLNAWGSSGAFDFNDWVYLAKQEQGGTSDGIGLVVTPSGPSNTGNWSFNVSTWSTYENILIVLKDGGVGDENIHWFAYLLKEDCSFGTWDYPGTNDLSYLAVYGRGGDVPVPEPATILLLGSGLVGLAGFGRKKFKK